MMLTPKLLSSGDINLNSTVLPSTSQQNLPQCSGINSPENNEITLKNIEGKEPSTRKEKRKSGIRKRSRVKIKLKLPKQMST